MKYQRPFYEEHTINGKLCFRETVSAEWKEVEPQALMKKFLREMIKKQWRLPYGEAWWSREDLRRVAAESGLQEVIKELES